MENRQQHTITALTVQKKKPWQTSVFVDGEFWRSCNTEIIIELSLCENQHFDIREFDELTSAFDKRRAFDRAVLLLSYRDRSAHELRERLIRAGFSETTASDTITKLKRLEYINDTAFSHAWAKSRTSSKQFGARRIKQELKDKGISDDIINDVLTNIEQDESEMDRARSLASKKLSVLKELDKRTAFRRLSQFLLRRGYPNAIVYDVCRELLKSDGLDNAH